MISRPKIAISVETEYVHYESDYNLGEHVFIYTITIINKGDLSARLLSRHWLITDGDGNTQEVRGEGVVGLQPHLKPGENFKYSSFAIINTPIGSMQGSYQMINEKGELFDAEIPSFRLANPMLVN